MEQTDITNKLVKKAIRGNVDAYGKLFEIYKDYLYRTAFTAMKNEDAAMDAVSDCMLNGFRSIHSLKTPEYFKTWITKILYNAINDYYRKNTLTEPFTDFEFPAVEELDADGLLMESGNGWVNTHPIGDHYVSKVDIFLMDYDEWMENIKGLWWTEGHSVTDPTVDGGKLFKDILLEKCAYHTEVTFDK